MSNTAPSAGAGQDRARRRARQAAAFDAIGSRYDRAFPHKDGQLAAGHRLIERLPAGARVLDVGCGTGIPTARDLAAAGFAVTGVDISTGMLELARANVTGAEFRTGDVLELDATTLGTYDAVVAFFTLLMLPRAEIPVAVKNLRDLLRPGGRLELAMVEADVDDVALPFLGHNIQVSGYPREELITLVESAGFWVAEVSAARYAPASAETAPETQLFLSCRRSETSAEG